MVLPLTSTVDVSLGPPIAALLVPTDSHIGQRLRFYCTSWYPYVHDLDQSRSQKIARVNGDSVRVLQYLIRQLGEPARALLHHHLHT